MERDDITLRNAIAKLRTGEAVALTGAERAVLLEELEPPPGADHRLYVNFERTLLVRIYPASGRVEAAKRDHENQIWGPPIELEEER